MAAGEYTSVASQRELVLAELDVERQQLRKHPVDEMEELAELYVSRGVEPALAREVAMQLSRDPEQALEIHAREELGIDPEDLPSPLVAAVSSFASFALGALLPYCRTCWVRPPCGRRCCWRWSASSAAGRSSPGSPRGRGGSADCASSSWVARPPV